MYICPTCHKNFAKAEDIAKHSLKCWKEHNPNHKSKPAPRSENIVERQMDDSIMSFFQELGCKK